MEMDGSGLETVDVLARLGVAALLGGAIGLEREYDGQDAGFRTHLLVVIGAALFAVTSVGAFDAFVATRDATNVTVDVTRIAAYVAPGIGFIGGGAILKYGGHVTGITTAASLWAAAAIGVASGLGFWAGAVAAAVIALVALELLQPVSNAFGRLGRRRRAQISVALRPDADVAAVVRVVRQTVDGNVRQLRYGVGPDDDGHLTIDVWRKVSDEQLASIAASPWRMPDVTSVSNPTAS